MIRKGLSFTVQLRGRQVRQRSVAASDMERFHRRPLELRHDIGKRIRSFGLVGRPT